MRARTAAPLFIILLLLQIATVHAATSIYDYTETYTYENRGTTPQTLTKDDVAVPLFLNNEYQKITITSSSPGFGSSYADDDGNMLSDPNMSLTLQPGAKIVVSTSYRIESSDVTVPSLSLTTSGKTSDIPANLTSEYTGVTETFWSNNTQIATIAKSVTDIEPTVLGKVTRLVAWFRGHIKYANHDIPLTPGETLAQGEGDCDDQAILLISMLRSLGIPAYLEIGIVFNSQISGNDTVWEGHLSIQESGLAWHGWAMVYVPPWGWIPVDLTLVSEDDPLQQVLKAPAWTAAVVTAMKVSNQSYTGAGEETRQRITASSIYITSVETVGGAKASWIDPTMVLLAVGITGAVVFMFWTARRRQQPIKPV